MGVNWPGCDCLLACRAKCSYYHYSPIHLHGFVVIKQGQLYVLPFPDHMHLECGMEVIQYQSTRPQAGRPRYLGLIRSKGKRFFSSL
jgi:hypothetical protein